MNNNDIITTAEIHTRHPERYLLHNAADGTTWSLTEDGRWVRANQPTEPAIEPARLNLADWCTCGHHRSAHLVTGVCNPCGASGIGVDAYPNCERFEAVPLPTEPARCAPSREALVDAIFDAGQRCVPGDAIGRDEAGTYANAVQALYASQRTEAEVKAEALKEFQASIRPMLNCELRPDGSEDPRMSEWIQAHREMDGLLQQEIERFTPNQPAPVFEAMGLSTAEVPNVGGEQR